ncbi:MAG: ABC transporter permease subunit [Ruminococcus sp.]|nr:ABC transporter permease subunit [Ruminococcus sp.]
MGAIFRREVQSYFTSPIGYIFLAAFYAFSAFFFASSSLSNGSTSMTSMYTSLMIILVVLIPILTMRTMSEDKKTKTDQCLLTAPVSLGSIVAGKFLAALLVYTCAVAITLVYAIIIAGYASVDWLTIIGNILGLELLGASFIAAGIFCSSFTENQVVAAVISFIVILALDMLSSIGSLMPWEWLENILTEISFYERYSGFTIGLFDLSNVLFFISAAVIFLFLTVRVLEKRRWS